MSTAAQMMLPPTPADADDVEQALRDALEALRISARHIKKAGNPEWAKAQLEIADELEARAFKRGYSPKAN